MAVKHSNPTGPRIDRRGQKFEAVAPYNFVPPPERMVAAPPLFDQDMYHPDTHTGWIDVTLDTCSPLYVRGMLTETQYGDFGGKGSDKLSVAEKETNAPFFSTHEQSIEGKPVPLIPGSSLRGMIRSLVEIISYGRMRWVGDEPSFTLRAVAASRGDPLREPYRQVMGAFGANVRAGYLERRRERDRERWLIHPAMDTIAIADAAAVEQTPFLKVAERLIGGRDISNFVRLNSANYRPAYYPVSFDAEVRRNAKGDAYLAVQRIGDPNAQYKYPAMLVCSGNMIETGQRARQSSPRKKHALVLMRISDYARQTPNLTPEQRRDLDRQAEALEITPEAIRAYRAGLTPFQNEELEKWGGNGWGVLQDGAPVFYVPAGKKQVQYFGHSPNFRIPIRLAASGETRAATPTDFVPEEIKSSLRPDLADAIFGWVQEEGTGPSEQRAGRVFFGDARFVSADNGVWLQNDPLTPRTLASPKATTFQHYLAQSKETGHNPDRKETLAHYGTSPRETNVRGHKEYWHKDAAPELEASEKEKAHEKQLTRIAPVNVGAHFQFRIYFENLRPEELGALWWALTLPGKAQQTYRHKLGMGKPLGMGAVALMPKLTLTSRTTRYETLFNGNAWAEGASSADAEAFLQAFETFVLNETGSARAKHRLADVERIQMLLAMLEWPGPDPSFTRYMEIEHGAARVNEFKERPVLPDPLAVMEKARAAEPTATQIPARASTVSSKQQPTPPRVYKVKEHFESVIEQIATDGAAVLFVPDMDPGQVYAVIEPQDAGDVSLQAQQRVECEILEIGKDQEGVTMYWCRPIARRSEGFKQGVVLRYGLGAHRDYGFIQSNDGGPDVYVHRNDLAKGVKELKKGNRVRFRVMEGMMGLKAQDVEVIE